MIDPKEALADPPIVKHGVKITEPGIYDCPMDWYHSDCCDAPSISSGGIFTLCLKTARKYFSTSPYNPKRREKEDTSAMAIGRGAHTLTFEPHLFATHYVVRPERYDSWRTKEAKIWRENQQSEGKTVFDPSEYEQVLGIVESLKEHPLYGQGLLEGYCERSLFWKDKETGFWLKSRPDAIPSMASTIYANLKCISRMEPRSVWYSAFEGGGAFIQAALGTMGTEELLGMKFEEFALVFVDQKWPHDILIQPLDPEAIEGGRKHVRKGLRIFERCLETGYWPSFDAHDMEYLKPSDAMKTKWSQDPEMK